MDVLVAGLTILFFGLVIGWASQGRGPIDDDDDDDDSDDGTDVLLDEEDIEVGFVRASKRAREREIEYRHSGW